MQKYAIQFYIMLNQQVPSPIHWLYLLFILVYSFIFLSFNVIIILSNSSIKFFINILFMNIYI